MIRSNNQLHRVLIVDDHAFVRLGLSDLISHEPGLHVCGTAAGEDEALRLVQSEKPDLVLVDISLEGIGGIELIKEIHAMRPDTRMLVVSMHDEELYAERALRAGAKGYVSKHEPTAKLLEAVHAVLDGKIHVSEAMARRMVQRAVLPTESPATTPIEGLSDRELEVFEHIGEGMTTQQIAQRLFLSSKTIETYREHIKTKLKIASSAELVRLAVRWQLEQK